MLFEIAGKCKQCGAELHFMLSAEDSREEIYRIMGCHACGNRIESPDVGRFGHLLDTIDRSDELNAVISLSKVVISHRSDYPEY